MTKYSNSVGTWIDIKYLKPLELSYFVYDKSYGAIWATYDKQWGGFYTGYPPVKVKPTHYAKIESPTYD